MRSERTTPRSVRSASSTSGAQRRRLDGGQRELAQRSGRRVFLRQRAEAERASARGRPTATSVMTASGIDSAGPPAMNSAYGIAAGTVKARIEMQLQPSSVCGQSCRAASRPRHRMVVARLSAPADLPAQHQAGEEHGVAEPHDRRQHQEEDRLGHDAGDEAAGAAEGAAQLRAATPRRSRSRSSARTTW